MKIPQKFSTHCPSSNNGGFIITIGAPGCGKLKFAIALQDHGAYRAYVITEHNVRVTVQQANPDLIDPALTAKVWESIYEQAKKAKTEHKWVVIEATNTMSHWRKVLLQTLRSAYPNTALIGVWFNKTLGYLMLNTTLQYVTVQHYHQMLKEEPPSLSEGFTNLIEL